MSEPIRKTYIGRFYLEEYRFNSEFYTYANGALIEESYDEAKEKLNKDQELNFKN